ncbi:MAG: hypothetical protein P8Y42_21210 [Exilibacterium sp.]
MSVLLCLMSLSAGAVIINQTDTDAVITGSAQNTRTFSVEAVDVETLDVETLDIEFRPTAADIISTVDNSLIHSDTVISIDRYTRVDPSEPRDENAKVLSFGFESLRFQLPARSMTTPEPTLFVLLVFGLIGLGFSYRE